MSSTSIERYTCDRCGKAAEVNRAGGTASLPEDWRKGVNRFGSGNSDHLCGVCGVSFSMWWDGTNPDTLTSNG